tara:strand:- start:3445 stop:3612 length:168 start_codon:yes stop_codon:yes gene_type:complete
MSMSSQSEIFSEGKYQQEKKAVLHAMASKLFCTSGYFHFSRKIGDEVIRLTSLHR